MEQKVRLQGEYLVEVLKQIRIELDMQGLTQTELGRRMKRGHGYINGLLKRRHSITFEKLFEILQALNLTPQEFFRALNRRLRSTRELPELLRLKEMVGEVAGVTAILRGVFEQLVGSGVLTRDEVDAANAQARAVAGWGDLGSEEDDGTPPS